MKNCRRKSGGNWTGSAAEPGAIAVLLPGDRKIPRHITEKRHADGAQTPAACLFFVLQERCKALHDRTDQTVVQTGFANACFVDDPAFCQGVLEIRLDICNTG